MVHTTKSRHSVNYGTAKVNGFGVLRSVLEKACTKAGCGLGEFTVLSPQVDPYRFDTSTGHRDGQWLAAHFERLVGQNKKIHWRGLHYVLVSTTGLTKPNGEQYLNDDANWTWLIDTAGKAARWLGYIPFERITDNRNAAPIIHRKAKVKAEAFVRIGIEVTIPDASDLEPTPDAEGFVGRQPYCFAIFGEKASLEDVLLPLTRTNQADLYLPTGEISDTLIFRIAKDAAADGRLVMFTVADCDPAGHQMAVSIGRKLQAFKDLFFPKLRFEVVPVALTVEQVRDLGLPSSPLKTTEKRADRWRQAFGIEQTEIDALATLRTVTSRRYSHPRATSPLSEDWVMTTSTQRWTVETGQNEYGWFESYAEADAFVRGAGGGTIHEYRNIRLTESKEITREEYEQLVQSHGVLLDPSKYASNG